MDSKINIVFVLFPNVTQLDFTGPLQVLSRLPGASVHLAAQRLDPVPTDAVLTLKPDLYLRGLSASGCVVHSGRLRGG